MPFFILGIPLVKFIFGIALLLQGAEAIHDSIKDGKNNRRPPKE